LDRSCSDPQLGHAAFARGAPEWVGSGLATAHQVDVVSFLWASMALFDDGARDVDTATVYRPAATALYDVAAARQRILLLLTAAPDGAPLERFLPAPPDRAETGSRAALRRRSASASTLMGGLELARQGEVVLAQPGEFQTIRVTAAGGQALSSAA
jgi:segregation and condensation protein A